MKRLSLKATLTLLANTSILLSLMLLIGRGAGFLREILLVKTFGASGEADMAIVLLTLPDFFTGILLAGGLTAALVPAFKKLDQHAAKLLFLQISVIVFFIFGIFSIGIYGRPEFIVTLFAPGLPEVYSDGRALLWFCVAGSIIFTALTGVTSAFLNSQEKFGIAGAGTLIFNVVVICGLLLIDRGSDPVNFFAIFVLLACMFRFASQLGSCRKIPVNRFFSENLLTRDLFSSFFSAFGATSLIVLVSIILRSIGSLMGVGNLAIINYATKLIELPLGIVITTIGIVALPVLSDYFTKKDFLALHSRFATDVWRGILLSAAIGLPLAWFSKELVVGVFGFGSLSVDAILQISDVVVILTLSLPAIAISTMQGAFLNATGKSRLYLLGVSQAFFCFLLFLVIAYNLKNFKLVIFSVVLFHVITCLFLRIQSKQPIFCFFKRNIFLLLKIISVSLISILLISVVSKKCHFDGRIASLISALLAISVSFFFSIWILNRDKANI